MRDVMPLLRKRRQSAAGSVRRVTFFVGHDCAVCSFAMPERMVSPEFG
ncbi:hypothetical protein [Marivita cryptomonadis]|nr:hypothetical protein [Marivita cryptomonadis]